MSGDAIAVGTVDPEIISEFPGLEVVSTRVAGFPRSTSGGLAHEMGLAAQRINGLVAAHAPTGTVAGAYRAFARQLGMDPSTLEGTADAVIRRRLMEGGFRPGDTLADACAFATLETGVPLTALSAAAAEGPVDLRVAAERAAWFAAGDLVLASGTSVLARLFGDRVPSARVDSRAGEAVIVAVGAPGVVAGLAPSALERVADLLAAC